MNTESLFLNTVNTNHMKYNLLLILLLIYSCSGPENSKNSQLMLADVLIERNLVDSACTILKNIKAEELVAPENKALYALLRTQANDKNYILHTNDSLILIAVNYYDQTENCSLRAKSHYYLGRVYQDMNDIRGVIREFLTAMPLAEEADDYYLICLLQGNLGLLFENNGLLEEADSLYKCAVRLAKKKNDSIRWATALLNIGHIGIERGEKFYNEAESNLKQALKIAEAKQSEVIVKRKASELLGCLYERNGNTPEAIHFTKKSLDLQTDSTQMYGGYLLLGSAYYKLQQYDSAAIYLNKSLHSSNNYTKEGAYMRLADIAKKQKHLEDAIIFQEKYNSYHNAAANDEAPIELIESLNEMIHQQTVNKYKSFIVQYKSYILFLFVILLFIIVLYLVKQKYTKRKFIVLQTEKAHLISCENQLQHKLHLKEIEIEQLNKQFNDCDNDRQKQRQFIIEQKTLMEEKELISIEICKLLHVKEQTIEMLNRKYFKPTMEETPIYQKIIAIKKENCKTPDEIVKLSESDWKELVQELNHLTNDFTYRLEKKYMLLSKDDIHFCCLIKIGFKFGEMKDILGCTLDAVYKREKAILKNKMQISSKIKLKEVVNNA